MLGLISAKKMNSYLANAGLLVAVLLMLGCSSNEMLVKVPSNSDSVTVDPYNTQTHKNNIDIYSPLPLQKKIEQQKLVQRAGNLFVLFDNSSAMQDDYRGMSRYEYGIKVLDRFHQTLPNMHLQGNVFKTSAYSNSSFFSRVLSTDNGQTETSWAVEQYDPAQMQKRVEATAITQVAGEGSLDSAISEISGLITGTNQPAVLLMVTRWERIDEKALIALARLRQKLQIEYEKELCVFTVGVGNNYSRARFDQSDSCGISVSADKIAQPRDMSHFIERMFFYGPADTDNDGIYDYRDKCPNTEKGRLVRFDGCKRFSAIKPLKYDLNKALAMVSDEQ